MIGSTRIALRPFGSSAEVPSVTSKEIDAGPKYLSAEVNTRVLPSRTRSEPSEWVARTELGSVRRTWRPPTAMT